MARPSLQPRPATGVFTSLLVTNGDTTALAEHVARLEASARQLFGKGLPGAFRDDLAAQLTGNPSGRLRITLQPPAGRSVSSSRSCRWISRPQRWACGRR